VLATSPTFGSCISAEAQQGVRADPGGIAIGGNVSGSTVNIGIPPNNSPHSSDSLPTFQKLQSSKKVAWDPECSSLARRILAVWLQRDSRSPSGRRA
jgi:hypothetical protein